MINIGIFFYVYVWCSTLLQSKLVSYIYTAARLQDRCDRVSTRACERFEAAQCVAVGAVRQCLCNDKRGFKASTANDQCLCQAGKTLNGTEGSEVACADGLYNDIVCNQIMVMVMAQFIYVMQIKIV